MENKKLLAVGNALVDSIVKLENDQIINDLGVSKGSMSLVDKATFETLRSQIATLPTISSIAGSANNCVRVAAKLGLQCGFIGKVGADKMGSLYSDNLNRYSIATHLSLNEDLPTGECVSLISADGERTMVTYLGAAVTLSPSDLDGEVFEMYSDGGVIFVEGYLVQSHDLIRHIFAEARRCGLEIAIDLASFNVVEESIELLHELLEDGVKIIFANEAEAESFTGIKEPEESILELSKYCDIAIVKIGKEGSLLVDDEMMIEVDATEDEAIDTTGAGDFYAGAFIYGYGTGSGLGESMIFGSIAGGAATTILGTNPSEQMWLDIAEAIVSVKATK